MKQLTTVLTTLALVLALLCGCTEREAPVAVSLENRKPLETSKPVTDRTLKICVGSMVTPQDGYVYYQRLLDYLGEKLRVNIRALDPGSYEQVNRMLESGEVDAAFVCGGPYVVGHERFGLELLAAPVVAGRSEYYSYLIVPTDSPARSLADLRGKTFAFADPQSNSGLTYPSYELARMGETPESFFNSYLFTYAHDKSVLAVADKMVDGAGVASLIWEYVARTQPELIKKTRILAKSPPFGIPPVVASPHLDAGLKQAIQDVLFKAHLDPAGREILRGMNIERFAPAEDGMYDSIRQMRRVLAKQAGEQP